MIDYEIELELTKLMQELQQNSMLLETTLAPFARLIENINKDMNELSQPISEKSIEIQDKIKELTLLRGKSLKTGSGNITYVKGAIRRNWDLNALDIICEIDEYIYKRKNMGF